MICQAIHWKLSSFIFIISFVLLNNKVTNRWQPIKCYAVRKATVDSRYTMVPVKFLHQIVALTIGMIRVIKLWGYQPYLTCHMGLVQCCRFHKSNCSTDLTRILKLWGYWPFLTCFYCNFYVFLFVIFFLWINDFGSIIFYNFLKHFFNHSTEFQGMIVLHYLTG